MGLHASLVSRGRSPHLAEATLTNYLQVANKWIRPIAGTWPLRAFEKRGPVNQLLSQAQREGVRGSRATEPCRKTRLRGRADRRPDPQDPVLRTDMGRRAPRRPRQRQRLQTGHDPAPPPIQACSCHVRRESPRARADRGGRGAHRAALLARSRGRTWEPHRDAILLRCEFGLGLRPEEMAAARWRSLARPTHRGDWILVIDTALSHGHVSGVKTTERSKRVPPIVYGWLTDWREVALAHGLAGRPPRTSSCLAPPRGGHFTLNQHKKWGGRYFRPAAEVVAREHPHLSYLAGATPYAARRGHITCRVLAGEPVQVIARSCGTSPATIHRHYFVAIDAAEAGHRLPTFEQQLADAVELVDGHRALAPRADSSG